MKRNNAERNRNLLQAAGKEQERLLPENNQPEHVKKEVSLKKHQRKGRSSVWKKKNCGNGPLSEKEKGTSKGKKDARNIRGKGSTAEESKGNSKEKKDTRVPRCKGSPATKNKGNSKSQEGKEIAEARVAWLQIERNKRETTIHQKMGEAKGFIEDEQQWLITGSLHIPAEFTTSEEDSEKFESQPKSPPGVKEPDEVKPSISYKSEMGAGDCHNCDKNGCHYLGKMDVVCGYCGGKGF